MFDSVILKKAFGLLDDHQSRVDLVHYQQAGTLSQYLEEIKGYLSGVLWFELGGDYYEETCNNRVRDLMASMLDMAEGLPVDDMHRVIDEVSVSLLEPTP
jgi:hypothetical protein